MSHLIVLNSCMFSDLFRSLTISQTSCRWGPLSLSGNPFYFWWMWAWEKVMASNCDLEPLFLGRGQHMLLNNPWSGRRYGQNEMIVYRAQRCVLVTTQTPGPFSGSAEKNYSPPSLCERGPSGCLGPWCSSLGKLLPSAVPLLPAPLNWLSCL